MSNYIALSRRLKDNGDCDAIVDNQNNPNLGWPYDEEERVMSMLSLEGERISPCVDSEDTESAAMDFVSFHQRQTSVDISVSLDHVEEYPSPSSVSLLHSSSEDLSAIDFSIPPLPLHRAENTNHNVSVESSSAMPSYRSRRRRREDDLDQSRNPRHSTAYLDLSFTDRPLSAPTSASCTSSNSSSSSEQRNRMWIRSPRVVLTLCAVTFVALSIHDRVEVASYSFHQQISSGGSRREEVAFPLGYSEESTHGDIKPKLPRFYLPRLEPPGDSGELRMSAESPRKDASAAKAGNTSSQLQQHRGTNFAMARAREARPIFVPDQPLPDGGFRKPKERFVFDPVDQQKQFRDHKQHGLDGHGSRALSWTSWLASVAFVGMLLDTGWKKYQRCRLLQEQERRL
jgi:hypothetical protein